MMAYCDQCGAEMPDNGILCPQCGNVMQFVPKYKGKKKKQAVHIPDKFGKYFKRFTILAAVILILAGIGYGVFWYDDHLQKLQYPLLAYEYKSCDSFYEVFETVKDVVIIDNDTIQVTAEGLEEDENGDIGLIVRVKNRTDDSVYFGDSRLEVNGSMQTELCSYEIEPKATEKVSLDISQDIREISDINRISMELGCVGEDTEWTSEYIRFYPNGKEAYEYEPPLINIEKILYDEDGVVLALYGCHTDYANGIKYFAYNGTTHIIDVLVQIEAMNELACHYKREMALLDPTPDGYDQKSSDGLLPGSYLLEIDSEESLPKDILHNIGYGAALRIDVGYKISGRGISEEDTVTLYPKGEEAYEAYSYEYQDDDVTVYEDSNYKITAIYTRNIKKKTKYIAFYVENRTNKGMKVCFDYVKINDEYSGYVAIQTNAGGDTVLERDYYKVWLTSEDPQKLELPLIIYDEYNTKMVDQTVIFELPAAIEE